MNSKKIGDYLLESSIIDEQTIKLAIDKQVALKKEGVFKPLGKILNEMFGISESDVKKAVEQMAFDVLSSTSLFTSLSRGEIETAIAGSNQVVLKDNEIIFCHGEGATSFFIIISGKVKIFVPSGDGTENVLTTLGAGEVLGEMALMTGEQRSASAKTLENTSLLVFSKAYFERLSQMSSEQSSAFISILAQRLIRGNEDLVTASENERTYQQLLSEGGDMITPEIIGKVKNIVDLRAQIDNAAQNEHPVIIYGESGTEKLVAAEAIHKIGLRANAPFLSMNAEDASLKGIASPGAQSLFQQEIVQNSLLFGHESGAIPSIANRRIGLLEICKAGTLVIENIDRLTDGVQQKLLDFLCSGTFMTLGGIYPVRSQVRVIATSVESLKALADRGKFNENLLKALSGNSLTVPPLRKRKSDLRLIVDALIDWECSKDEAGHKRIRTISDDAYQRIMQYDWPGNMEELSIVIRRAINLASHDILLSEDIFIGIVPPSGKHSFNLLRFEKIHAFFLSRYFPVALQICCALIFSTVLFLALAGSSSPDKNVSLIIVWALWWPMLVLSWFVGARIWCSICPMGALNDFFSAMCNLKLKVPAFIRDYGLYLSVTGLGLIIWAEAATDMTHSPKWTAMLLLTITLCALVSGLLFERRLWCRYLCPLGRMGAVFSSCSMVEWRSNLSICNNVCKTNQCFKGTEAVSGCPLYQGPFSLKSNQNCILCGKCIKVCEHASPALNIRFPGHELWAVLKPDKVIAIFVPTIIGTQIFRGLDHTQELFGYQAVPGAHEGSLAMLLIVATIVSFLYIHLSGALAFGPLRDSTTKKKDLFCYVIIPVAFGFEVGYHLETSLGMIGHFFPVIGRQLGVNLDHLDFTPALGSALPWQLFLLILGACVSIGVMGRLRQKHQQDGLWETGVANTLPITFLFLLYCMMFILR